MDPLITKSHGNYFALYCRFRVAINYGSKSVSKTSYTMSIRIGLSPLSSLILRCIQCHATLHTPKHEHVIDYWFRADF